MRLRSLLRTPGPGSTPVSGRHHLARECRRVAPTTPHAPPRRLPVGEPALTGMPWRRAERDSDAYARRPLDPMDLALAAGLD